MASNTELHQHQPSLFLDTRQGQSMFSGADVTKRVLIGTVTVDELGEAEADGIAFMRGEEKLARDVHLTLADICDLRIFANISRPEPTHMDAVLEEVDGTRRQSEGARTRAG
jgi:hypothetical protein